MKHVGDMYTAWPAICRPSVGYVKDLSVCVCVCDNIMVAVHCLPQSDEQGFQGAFNEV